MSNQPFDAEVINALERPLSSDINLVSSYAALALMSTTARQSDQRAASTGQLSLPMVPVGNARFYGAGFLVQPVSPAGMQVSLVAGLGFFNDNTTSTGIGGISGLNDPSVFKPLTLTAAETINVPMADPSNARIDIIEVLVSAAGGRRLTDSSSRDILNTTTGTFVPAAVFKTLTYNLNGTSTVNGIGPINYKTGSPSGSPVAPAPDAGYVKIAEVTVAAGATTLAGATMRDFRSLLFPMGNAIMQGQLIIATTTPTGAYIVAGPAAPPGLQIALTYAPASTLPAQANLFIWPAPTGYLMGSQVGPTLDLNNSRPLTAVPPNSVPPTTLSSSDQAALTAEGFIVSTGQPVFKQTIQVYGPFSGSSFGWDTRGASGTFAQYPFTAFLAPNV